MNKLNDWLKVLLVHLGGCIIGGIPFVLLTGKYEWEYNLIPILAALLMVYYFFAGYFLKKVKAYKVLLMIILPVVVIVLASLNAETLFDGSHKTAEILLMFLLGGVNPFIEMYYVLFRGYEPDWYLFVLSMLIPLLSIYLGMIVGRISQRLSEKEISLGEGLSDTKKLKLNTWERVLIAYFAGGILAVIYRGPARIMVSWDVGGNFLLGFTASFALLMLVFFAFVGIFLRKAEFYKVLFVYVGFYVLSVLIGNSTNNVFVDMVKAFLSGSSSTYVTAWWYFENIREGFKDLKLLASLTPFFAVSLSMLMNKLCAKNAKKKQI